MMIFQRFLLPNATSSVTQMNVYFYIRDSKMSPEFTNLNEELFLNFFLKVCL